MSAHLEYRTDISVVYKGVHVFDMHLYGMRPQDVHEQLTGPKATSALYRRVARRFSGVVDFNDLLIVMKGFGGRIRKGLPPQWIRSLKKREVFYIPRRY